MQVSPYILLALTSLFWSLNFVIGKLVATVMPPATISVFRWLVPCGILLLVSWQEIRAHAPIFRAKWRLILLLGATGYGLNSMCVYEAVRLTTTINTSFINAFNPVLIAVAGYVMYRARIDRVQGVGFLLSLVGVLCIIFQGHWERVFRLQMNGGDLFMLASISIWSVHTVLYQHTVPDFPDRAMFTVMMVGGLLATLPFAVFESALEQWAWVTRVGPVQVGGHPGAESRPLPAGLSLLEPGPSEDLGEPGGHVSVSDSRLHHDYLGALSGRAAQVLSCSWRCPHFSWCALGDQ
jgi:drug/metabolite transporter (DMT)-like permease